MISIKIQKTFGRGKFGKQHIYISPDYYCANKSRKASGFDNGELDKSINNILHKYYKPELFVYEIDGHTIVSNNSKNALIEFWRICEREYIGKEFIVTKK